MRPRFALLLVVTVGGALAQLFACSSAEAPDNGIKVMDPKDGGRKDTSGDIPPEEDSSTQPDAGPTEGRVYAHTARALYLFEPLSRQLTLIGDFTGILSFEEIVDLAVDRTGSMFATTIGHFYKVDPITAKCTEIGASPGADYYPNALSFVPAGTLDPSKEALVGYAALGSNIDRTDYVRIDTTTGAMTLIGDINPSDAGTQYKSSGDIVSIIQDNNRTYATVKVSDGPTDQTDLLAEVNPINGNIKTIIGNTKEADIFGFGYWAGKGYGFAFDGRIVEINMTTGNSLVIKTLVDDAGAPIPWYGAGVTTQAPK